MGNNNIKQIRLDKEYHSTNKGMFLEWRTTRTNYEYTYEIQDIYRFIKSMTSTAYGEIDMLMLGWDIGDDKAETNISYINDMDNWILGLEDEVRLFGFDKFNFPILRRAMKYYYYPSPTFDLKETVQWDGSAWVNPVHYDYDEYGNVIKITDPLGNIMETVYDDYFHSFPVMTVNAKGHKAEIIYDVLMRNISTIDPNGISHRTEYDEFSRVTRK